MFPHMFKRGRIGTMRLKNRLVMPPMVRNYADKKGLVTQRYVDHIDRVARGGVGMMILEASYIAPEGKGFVNELGIHSDVVIPGLKKLVKVAHVQGAKIGIQLYHAGRQTSSKITGKQPVAPSEIPDPTVNEIPHELTIPEIKRLVNAYGRAALRAKKAGFDFVEVHGAHGYLITQFLSPFSNRRTDEYGGTPEKRMRFMKEVYSTVRRAVGEDFPVVLRLSGDEMVEGGLSITDTTEIARVAEALGVDALHISVGNYASYARGFMIPPMAMPDGPIVQFAKAIKKAVHIPVITVAKIRTPQMAESILKKGDADYIGIGRTLLADPDWPNKVKKGTLETINKCIACNQGCISRLFAQQDVWCTVNPETGRERLFAKKKGVKRRVVVIGGGPAGLQAAIVAASRGHSVILYEKTKKLGGQLDAAAAAPHREDWRGFKKYLIQEAQKLNIDIHLGVEATSALIKKDRPHTVIVAVGSDVARPNIPGVANTNVVVARDLLTGRSKAKGTVVIAGGGCMGAQTAEFLVEKGHKVTIVEATGSIATDAPSDDRALLLERLSRKKVALLTESKVMSIDQRSVSVEGHHGVHVVPADTVVLCLGSYPADGLTKELKSITKNVVIVGDAREVRRVTEAVAEGALAALAV